VTGVSEWLPDFGLRLRRRLPRNIYRNVLATSAPHQLVLVALTAGVALSRSSHSNCSAVSSMTWSSIVLDPWMALAAAAIFIPQLLFVPLLQAAVNRRTGAGSWCCASSG